MKKSFSKICLVAATVLLTGCSASPNLNTGDTGAGLPMAQVDSENYLANICTDVIMKSGTIGTTAVSYISRFDTLNDEEKSSLLTVVEEGIKNAEDNKTKLSNLNFAETVSDKKIQAKNMLDKIVDDLTALKAAIEADDKDSAKAIYSTYQSDVEQLKNISM